MSETVRVWGQDMKRLKPLHDWMVCKIVREEEDHEGLVLPEAYESVLVAADVIAVGRGCWVKTASGRGWAFAETTCKPGDRIVLPQFAVEEVGEAGSDYVMVREQQALAIRE